MLWRTCRDDRLIESKSKMHVAYIVAASPNPQPRDDVLYKDTVWHSSRALSRPSNTKPLKNTQKTHRRQKTEDRSQTMPCPELLPNDHSPAHAIGGVNHMPIPKLGSRLCCRLQLSWLPVSRSSEGDTQSCCIVIGIALKNCIEGTAPTSRNIVDSRTQPLGPNHGLCCRCWCRCRVEIGITCCTVAHRNWRHFSVAMLTSAWQTKWKCWSSFLFKRKCS